MIITLINPPYYGIEDDHVEQNLGLAYLAAVLIENNYIDTNILELTGTLSLSDSLKKIRYADIYGISCYTTSYKNVCEIIKYIKESINPNAYIIVGGPHPSALPNLVYKKSGADLVIVGEGEKAILKAVRSFETRDPIYGVEKGEAVNDLDTIPFPIRLLDEKKPFSRTYLGQRTASLLATRGCPYKCLHCNSNIMGAGSNSIRWRSVDNIINEIRILKERGINSFRFNDDNFLAHPFIEDLLLNLQKEKISFRVFGNVKYLTEEICELLNSAGGKFVSIGIESMNPQNLKFLKKMDNLRYIENLTVAHKHGIIIRASFIVGLPYDTDESIEHYFTQASKLPINEFAVYPLIPYPGTGIAEYAKELYYTITNKDFEKYMQMGKDGEAGYCLSYSNPNTHNKFGPDDVKRWKFQAENILSKTMEHMKKSSIAQ